MPLTPEATPVPFLSSDALRDADVVGERGRISLLRLNPENSVHLAVAHQLDADSPEAMNPADLSHSPMSDEQLKDYMAGDKLHASRYVAVLVSDGKAIGGTIDLYCDDPKTDDLAAKTIEGISAHMELRKGTDIYGLNFNIYDDVIAPEATADGIRIALTELKSNVPENHHKRTMIAFLLDPRDYKDEMALKLVGFWRLGDMPNPDPEGDHPTDDIYILNLEDFDPEYVGSPF